MSRQADVADELVAIKRLLILALAKDGMTQSQLAAALGVDRSVVSKMFPTGTFTGLSKKGGHGDE